MERVERFVESVERFVERFVERLGNSPLLAPHFNSTFESPNTDFLVVFECVLLPCVSLWWIGCEEAWEEEVDVLRCL